MLRVDDFRQYRSRLFGGDHNPYSVQLRQGWIDDATAVGLDVCFDTMVGQSIH